MKTKATEVLRKIYAEKKRNKFHSEINDRFNKFRQNEIKLNEMK